MLARHFSALGPLGGTHGWTHEQTHELLDHQSG